MGEIVQEVEAVIDTADGILNCRACELGTVVSHCKGKRYQIIEKYLILCISFDSFINKHISFKGNDDTITIPVFL